ncbi:MAG: hypothetical protein FWC00_02090 [Firmicutes bacterium]|nr:hypothetical protein [Bacillota bacterium]
MNKLNYLKLQMLELKSLLSSGQIGVGDFKRLGSGAEGFAYLHDDNMVIKEFYFHSLFVKENIKSGVFPETMDKLVTIGQKMWDAGVSCSPYIGFTTAPNFRGGVETTLTKFTFCPFIKGVCLSEPESIDALSQMTPSVFAKFFMDYYKVFQCGARLDTSSANLIVDEDEISFIDYKIKGTLVKTPTKKNAIIRASKILKTNIKQNTENSAEKIFKTIDTAMSMF